MNKSDAKKYAARMLCGMLEQLISAKKSQKTIPIDPLVYDWPFDGVDGQIMSKNDQGRVWDALIDFQDELGGKGKTYKEEKDILKGRPIADGKPGKKWPGYKDQRKRFGFTKP